jgi:hypothetical protein
MKWKYKVKTVRDMENNLVDVLEEAGFYGWELVSSFRNGKALPPIVTFIFKREDVDEGEDNN